MAVKATPTTSSPLKKLEEQLTCAVCLDLYTDPKTLPCLHSFCQQCLEGLPLDPKGDTYFVTCPTCRQRTELPKPAGVAGFPVAFQLNQLKEIYGLMKKVSNPEQVTCDNCSTANAIGYCKECSQFLCQECIDMHKRWARFASHQVTSLEEMATSTSQLVPPKQETTLTCSIPNHDEPLKYFCETCDDVICRDCAILSHKDHKYNLIPDSYRKHCEMLELSLDSVKEKVDAMKNVVSTFAERENEIREQGEVMKEEIRAMVEEMVRILRQSERQLTRQVERVTDGKLQVLSEQKKSAEMSLSNVKDCTDYVEQILKIGSPQQVLMFKKQMMERMSQVTQQVNVEKCKPPEKVYVQLIKDSKAIKSLHHIGDIVSYSSTALQQCKVKKISQIEHLPEEKKISFPLSMELPDSSLLTVPLTSLSCSLVPVGKGQPITATVTSITHPGVYRIHCSPSTRGHHQVNLQVHDVQLESSSLVIPFNPYLDTITPVCTVGELNQPWGVAVSDDGHVIVTENRGHCVTVLDREGKNVKSFGGKGGSGNLKFSSPHGVAITADNFILVTDNDRIQKITMNGQCIASVGEEGDEPLEFDTPDGIAISPISGCIYVADRQNHRIQVLTPDLNFFHSFGKEGSAEGQFNNPRGIAIDSQGLLYVADWGNDRIQKFTPEGKFLAQFGTKGSGPGQLKHPAGITIDSTNLVYVAERDNHRVSVFTSDGQFVRSFGKPGINEDQFKKPVGITFDKDGVLYICDWGNNRLVVY